MAGVGLDGPALAQLWTFHQLLHARNDDGDLTRLRAFGTMVALHYVDCLLVAQKLAESDALDGPVVDIGSGAGFPGIPLALARPQTTFVLSEGRHRRVAFLTDAVAALGLGAQVHVFGHQIHAGTQGLPLPVRGIVTRALERVPVTLARTRHLVPPGGTAVFLKGPHCDDELVEAAQHFGRAWRLERDEAYAIPATTHRRRLVVFRRLDDPAEVARRRTRDIDSEANPDMKRWASLLQGRGVRKEGLALLAGARTVPEALRDFPHRAVELLVPRGTIEVPTDAPPGLAVTVLAPLLFRSLDTSGTGQPLLVVAAPDLPVWDGRIVGCTLAIPFQDPENVGAVLRSAAAFGVEDVVLLEEAAHPFHPKALRAGGTAALRMRLWRGPSLKALATQDLAAPVIALSTEGQPLTGVAWPADFLLVAGVEGPGLPPELRAHAVAIPMTDGSESLNAGVAAAVAMYAWAVRESGR